MTRTITSTSENPGGPGLLPRREFITKSLALTCAANLLPHTLLCDYANAKDAWTEWGWPQPYKTVSLKSIDWLKSKGWWPLQVAWNPVWSDGNLLLFVMRQQKLLEKRGIEVQYSPFLQAGLMNEVYIPGRVQVVQAGSFGLLAVIDRKVPTVALACYPVQRQAFMVHPKSPLKNGLIELKGQQVLKRAAVVGVSLGSSQHLGLLLAARVLGLEEGKDFVVKNAIAPDLITMPAGLDVVVIFEPNVILMEEFLKNARVIDLTDNYAIFNGYSYLRGEIEEGAPDVVQAYVDALIEAQLYARLKPAESVAALAADPSQLGRDAKLIERDAEIHVFRPKPTAHYPFEDINGLWIPLELFQADIMADAGVLRRRYTEQDFKNVFRPRYMADTFDRLGWAIPKRPPFLPSNWPGKIGHPPYPPYGIMTLGKQQFPEPGDLVREWTFGGTTYKT
jgi:ABC-type nitrate/sulfonate/bicarbonate transport system substrate-binding protein